MHKIKHYILSLTIAWVACSLLISPTYAQGPIPPIPPMPHPDLDDMPSPDQLSMGDIPVSPIIVEAAAILEMNTSELVAAMRSGQTIAEVAAEKNITVDELADAMMENRARHLRSFAEHGAMTEAEIEASLERLREHMIEQLHQSWQDFEDIRVRAKDDLEEYPLGQAAEVLGLTTIELLNELHQTEKTIADIAAERGVSLQTVINAYVAAFEEDLDLLVSEGAMTREEANQRRKQIRDDAEKFMHQSWPHEFDTNSQIPPPPEPGTFSSWLRKLSLNFSRVFQP